MWRGADKSWTVNLSTGSGFVMQRWTGAWGSDGPINVGDLNGDGRTDVFMWRGWNNDWTINLSTGSGFAFQVWQGAWGSDGTIRVGDLNADGKTDVFMYRAAGSDWTVNLSTGSGFAMQRWLGACGSDGPTTMGDYNGDGRTDVAIWRDANKDWLLDLSTGSGFNMQRWTGAWGSDGPILSADVTGDGRTDVLMWRDWAKDWTVNRAQLVALGAARTADYGISAVEVTQATQSMDNRVPLFAGKRTLVRAYADAGVCSSGPPLANAAIEATLYSPSSFSQPVWGPVTVGPQTVPRRIDRSNLGDTINFELPKDGPTPGVPWSTTQGYWLRVRHLSGNGETAWTFVRFYDSVKIHIRPFYDDQSGHVVTHDEFMRVVKRVEAEYPTSEIVVHDFSDVLTGISWGKLGDARVLAKQQDAADLLAGRPPQHCSDCIFVGVNWVPPGTGPGGLAASTPASDIDGRLAVVDVEPTDTNWSAGTMAQEIAHLLGRYHTPGHDAPYPDTRYPYPDGASSDNGWYFLLPNVVSHGRYYGADPATNPSLPANEWHPITGFTPDGSEHHHDYMAYGAWVDIWTSDFTYRGVCNGLLKGYADTWYSKRSDFPAGALPTESVCPY